MPWEDMLLGAVLQTVEAASLGLPLEVWKTRMGSCPQERARDSFAALYKEGGVAKFWSGVEAKSYESASKGAVLLFSKEWILGLCGNAGMDTKGFTAGAIAGAGGGICQTVVMSPLTFVVTCKTRDQKFKGQSTLAILKEAGFAKAYGSASAMALRQASNWALRQGLEQWVQKTYKNTFAPDRNVTTIEKVGCGLLGGVIACVNQPIEVIRIQVQDQHRQGNMAASTISVGKDVMAKHGIAGFYRGFTPRCMLSAYQTLYMVTLAKMVREYLGMQKK